MTTQNKLILLNNFLNGKSDFISLMKLKEELEKDLKNEIAGNAGKQNLNLFKFVQSFIKKEYKVINRYSEHKGIIKCEDRYYLCNGFYVIEFENMIEGVDVIDSEKVNLANLKKLFDDHRKDNSIQYLIEDLNELKLECKKAEITYKQEKTAIIDLIQDGITYSTNASQLLNCLKVIKNPKIMLGDNNMQPIYISGDNNINAIILPVRR